MLRSLLFFSVDDVSVVVISEQWMAQGKHQPTKRNFLFTVIFHHSYRTNFSLENKLEVIILEYWSGDSRFALLSCRYVLEYKVCCYHIDNFLLLSRFIKRKEKRWHERLTGWRRKCFFEEWSDSESECLCAITEPECITCQGGNSHLITFLKQKILRFQWHSNKNQCEWKERRGKWFLNLITFKPRSLPLLISCRCIFSTSKAQHNKTHTQYTPHRRLFTPSITFMSGIFSGCYWCKVA